MPRAAAIAGLTTAVVATMTAGASPASAGAPTIAIADVADGDILRGTAHVAFDVAGSSPVEKVDLFAGSKWLGADTSAPFEVAAPTWWAAPGSQPLRAKLTASDGSVRYSAPVNVTIPDQGVRLTGLTSGTKVGAGTAAAAADVTDPDSVAHVDLFADGVWMGSATQAPYTYLLRSGKLATGNHAVKLKVTDVGGGVRYTSAIGVFTDATQPSVGITGPTGGQPGDKVTIAAAAADDDRVLAVDFYAGTKHLGRDMTAPYNVSYTVKQYSEVLKAKVTDPSGNIRYSTSLAVAPEAAPAPGSTAPGAGEDGGAEIGGGSGDLGGFTDTDAPMVVSGLTAQPGDRSATLTWSPSLEPDLAYYKVTSGGALVAVVQPGSTRTTVTGLTNGVRATFQVSAVDTSGNESMPRPVSVTPADTVAPASPTALVAAPGDASATVAWSPSTADDIAGYEVLVNGRVVATTDATTTTATVTGLTNGAAAAISVVAVDDDGLRSTASNTAEVVPAVFDAAPDAPTGVGATSPKAHYVVLTWKKSVASDVASYRIYQNSEQVGQTEAAVSTYTIGDVATKTTYTFAVDAVDKAGNISALSAPITVYYPNWGNAG